MSGTIPLAKTAVRAILLILGLMLLVVSGARLVNRFSSRVSGPSALQENRFVEIGGIDQFVRIRMTDPDNPVILFLHGGPGFPVGYLSPVFQPQIDHAYTTVHWDQRHSGRTYFRNTQGGDQLSVEQLLSDLDELVDYLRIRFEKEKIILLGQSWGSVLGTSYLIRHPEKLLAYIGVGQVVDFDRGKILAAETAMRSAQMRGDDETRAAIAHALDKFSATGTVEALDLDNLVVMIGKSASEIEGDRQISPLRQMWLGISSPEMNLQDLRWFLIAADTEKIFAHQRELIQYMYYKFDLATEMKASQVPLYFISGENDWITPHSLVTQALETVDAPDKRFFTIAGTGHTPFLDQPEEFARILLNLPLAD
jgi:pimeloyl-ACP methyl ester carboxylesterase